MNHPEKRNKVTIRKAISFHKDCQSLQYNNGAVLKGKWTTHVIQIANQILVNQKLSPVPPCISWTFTNQNEKRKLHIDRDTGICLHIFFLIWGGGKAQEEITSSKRDTIAKITMQRRNTLHIWGNKFHKQETNTYGAKGENSSGVCKHNGQINQQ